MLLYSSLLIIHILCGCTSLLAGYSALIVKRGGPRHKKIGKIYVFAMSAVTATAYIMAVLKPNAFLFAIAVFTTYFIYTGWSMVGGRWKTHPPINRMAAYGFLSAAVFCLILLAYVKLMQVEFNDTIFITALIFSFIAVFITLQDIRGLSKVHISETERIIKHLSSMCAGLIATTTAMMVTLISYFPFISPIIAWIGPTIVLTPLIFYWESQWRAKAP